MRFLASGDLQIHKWQQFAYTNKRGMNSRLANCLKVLSFLRKTAIERGISKILLNGDILEECDWIDVEVLDGLSVELEKIYKSGIDTTINLGNHDVHGEFGGRVLHALRAFRGFATVVEKPTLVWNHVQVVPWISSVARFKSTIRNLEARKDYCLALHCGVQGATTGPKSYLVRNPIKLRDIRYKEYGLVVLSDYHTRQRLAKNPSVWYLGSPLQHSFGEIHRPCIWDISLDRQGLFNCEKVYTNFPRFRRVQATDINQFRKDTRHYSGDYVEVTIPDGRELHEDTIHSIAKERGFHVRIRNEGTTEEDGIQDSKSLSFRMAMKRYVSSNVKSKSMRKKLLKLGWKIFSGEI